MPNRLFCLAKTSALMLAVVAVFASSPAHAGFQWVAPGDNMVPMPAPSAWPAPVVSAAPQATMAPEVISPVIIGGNAPVVAPAVAPAVATPVAPPVSGVVSDVVSRPSNVNKVPPETPVIGGSVSAVPTAAVVAPESVSTISTSHTAAAAPPADIVRGFAKQVPLAVALRQILPSGYGFSVDPDVDLGTRVSFQGGKPWRDTLQDALTASGLSVREQGQMVMIGHSAPTPQLAALVPAVPVPATVPQPVDVAPAPLAAPAQVMTPTVETWHAERGDTLHKIVQAWADRAHIEVHWVSEYDYPLQASYSFTGTFEDALRNILVGFQEAHPQPVAELHDNAALGQRILIVQTRGNTNTD